VTDGTPDRHLSAEGFAEYLAADVPVVLPIPGDPRVALFIDPTHHRIGLHSPSNADEAAISNTLEHVVTRFVNVDGARSLEVECASPQLFSDIYPMLCAIADRIQLDGDPATDAVERTVELWRALLAKRKRLSDEQEIGLVGELYLVRRLVKALGADPALSSWRGPYAEEHDFGFPGFDVEAKTTRSERRRHWINGLTQLVPTQGRPLWLVSVQVTRGGLGDSGRTLPHLIDEVRRLLIGASAQARFDSTLSKLNWSDDQRDLYRQAWVLRTEPRSYAIDMTFPVMSSASIGTLGIDLDELVDVRYEVDLTNRPAGDPPPPIDAVVLGEP